MVHMTRHTTAGDPARTPDTHVFLLDPADLANKWGFGDGDLFDELLQDWATSRGLATDTWDEAWPYLSSRMLLTETVRAKLLPRIPTEIAEHVLHLNGVHNPVRIPHWEDDPRAAGWEDELNRHEPVKVTAGEVRAVIDSMFGTRHPSWIAVFNTIARETGPGYTEGDARQWLADTIDAAGADDEELRLGAELLAGYLTQPDVRRRLTELQRYESSARFPRDEELISELLHTALSTARHVLH